jgi:hypothetical protein
MFFDKIFALIVCLKTLFLMPGVLLNNSLDGIANDIKLPVDENVRSKCL